MWFIEHDAIARKILFKYYHNNILTPKHNSQLYLISINGKREKHKFIHFQRHADSQKLLDEIYFWTTNKCNERSSTHSSSERLFKRDWITSNRYYSLYWLHKMILDVWFWLAPIVFPRRFRWQFVDVLKAAGWRGDMRRWTKQHWNSLPYFGDMCVLSNRKLIVLC